MEDSQDHGIEISQRLSKWLLLSYGAGHVLNDICSAMWFSYLLIYFRFILGFEFYKAGIILFIGQVADAISTPFVGIESDKTDNFWLCRKNRRKTWYLIGTICVLGSFPFIFNPCINCEHASYNAQMVYYSAFVAIFQFGWASVQISHLALIPELTDNAHHRTQLTAIRYSFTVLSNIFVYLVAWLFLRIETGADPSIQLGPGDSKTFEKVSFIGLGVGLIASVLFYIGVKENKCTVVANRGASDKDKKSVKQYFADLLFYKVAAIYMGTRLFVNLGQVFVPLYLHDSLGLHPENLAIIPLVMFLSSLGSSFIVHSLNKCAGRKVAYMIGALIGLGGCVWIRFGSGEVYNKYEIYAVAVLLGFGGSLMLVTSLGITADLIGKNTNTGAFVYGAMSFTDKLANGLAVLVIQDLRHNVEGSAECKSFFRDVLAYVVGGSALIGTIALLSTKLQDHKTYAIRENTSAESINDSDEPYARVQSNRLDVVPE